MGGQPKRTAAELCTAGESIFYVLLTAIRV